MGGKIRVKVYKTYKNVWVSDTDKCKKRECFKPHNCPVQGAMGVRSSDERWMCLTNFYSGCPEYINM